MTAVASPSNDPSRSAPSSGTDAGALARRYWFPVVLLIAVIVFITQNRQEIPVSFLSFQWRASAWLVYTIVVLVGLVIGWFLHRRRIRRLAVKR